jgi:DNA gyrase subunit A
MEDYRCQTRGGKGLITYRTTDKTGMLAGIALVDESNDVVLINDTGVIIRLSVMEIPILSRVTQGVTLMRSKVGKVVDIAVVEHEEETLDDGSEYDEPFGTEVDGTEYGKSSETTSETFDTSDNIVNESTESHQANEISATDPVEASDDEVEKEEEDDES